MKNFVQPGNALDLIAPSGGVVSGNAYLFSGLLVVAATTAAQGEKFVGYSEGVFSLPKVAASDFVPGEIAYWDNGSDKRFEKTATGLFPCATCIETTATNATTMKVKLYGHAVAAVPAP